MPASARAASQAPILVDMARSLWLRFGPSLRIVIAKGGASSLPDRHEEALAAMRSGDAAGLRDEPTLTLAHGQGAEVLVFDLAA